MECTINGIARVNEGPFRDFMEFLQKNVDIERIARWTKVDLYSKKLDLF